MKISEKLKRLLKAGGFTQEALAHRLDVSFVTLNSWVNERSTPRRSAQLRIEELFLSLLGADEVSLKELQVARNGLSKLRLTSAEITENKQLFKKLMLQLTYHTNTIEGSTMTLADTEAVLFHGGVLRNRTQIEQLEATNHQAALNWLLGKLNEKTFELNQSLILSLHSKLTNGILSDAGHYRTHSVRIMGSPVTVANHHKLPSLIDEFVPSAREKTDISASLATTHAAFEKIHPFSDGNGRVGRLLMLAQALKAGYVPPLVVKERRFAYYKYLELAQTVGKHEPLELFICQSMERAARELGIEF